MFGFLFNLELSCVEALQSALLDGWRTTKDTGLIARKAAVGMVSAIAAGAMARCIQYIYLIYPKVLLFSSR